MYGVSEIESYHLLDAVSLAYGMLEQERDQMLHNYVSARYEMRPDSVFARVLQRYNPGWHLTEHEAAVSAEQTRDQLLSILSDARVTAPVLQMGNFHSVVNPKSYLYVFTHRSKYGDYPGVSETYFNLIFYCVFIGVNKAIKISAVQKVMILIRCDMRNHCVADSPK